MTDFKTSFGMVCVSALCVLATCTIATGLRSLTNRLMDHRPFIQLMFLEAIAAAELCGCCFELIVVADNFSVSTYAVFLFVLTMWWSANWGEATACPYTHLEEWWKGDADIRDVFLKVFAELSGGLIVFKYVQWYWSLHLVETHEDMGFDCTADLQVSVLLGVAIEALGTCLCRLASRALSDAGLRFAPMFDSFVSTSLVVAAFNYSGGYYNPVLATSLKLGCKGHTYIEHIVVYWLGACAGAILSLKIYDMPLVQRMFFKQKEE